MSKSGSQWTVSQSEFARHCLVSPKQISRYMTQGLPFKRTGNRVEIVCPDAILWFNNYKESQRDKDKGPDGDKLSALRLRRETAQTALEELRLKEAENSTMLVDEHERLLAEGFGRVRAKLLNFAARAAASSFGAQTIASAQEKLDVLVREIMEDLTVVDDVPLPDDGFVESNDDDAGEDEG